MAIALELLLSIICCLCKYFSIFSVKGRCVDAIFCEFMGECL